MYRADPTTKNYWTLDVNSAEVEKPCYKVSARDPKEKESDCCHIRVFSTNVRSVLKRLSSES